MSYNPLKTNLKFNNEGSKVPAKNVPPPLTNFKQNTNPSLVDLPSNPNLNTNRNQLNTHNVHLAKRGSKVSFDYKNIDNVFERHKYLVNEIKRKDKKIIEFQKMLEEVKLSDDPVEIKKLNNLLNEKKNLIQSLQNRNFELMESKNLKKRELDQLEKEMKEKTLLYEERLSYAKSKQELEKELAILQEEYKANRAALGRQDLKVKMEIEAECRETIENKLYLIVMETAKNKQDPEIQKLYNKLLSKQKA
jgi:hypothetical protein